MRRSLQPCPRITSLRGANAGDPLRDNGMVMTLTQLNAFVLVARLGSVTAAANALGVSEPAVSQALTALRQHLGDQLITRGPAGMTLTAGRLPAARHRLADRRARRGGARRGPRRAGRARAVAGRGHLHDRGVRGQPADGGVHPAVRGLGRGVGRRGGDQARWRCWSPTGWPMSRSGRQRGGGPGAAGGERADLPVPPGRGHRRAVARCAAARGSGAGWWIPPAPTRAATPASCWPGCGYPRTGSGCSRTRPPPGRPRPTAREWPRRSSIWSPSNCAGASSPWSRCPARRWTPAGT